MEVNEESENQLNHRKKSFRKARAMRRRTQLKPNACKRANHQGDGFLPVANSQR
jgi:hypothetical protein